MKTETAIKHFGSVAKLAQATGYFRTSIYRWGEYPDYRTQLIIERASNGALKAEKNDRPRKRVNRKLKKP